MQLFVLSQSTSRSTVLHIYGRPPGWPTALFPPCARLCASLSRTAVDCPVNRLNLCCCFSFLDLQMSYKTPMSNVLSSPQHHILIGNRVTRHRVRVWIHRSERKMKSEKWEWEMWTCDGKLSFVKISFPVFDYNVEMQAGKYIVFFGVWLIMWKWT